MRRRRNYLKYLPYLLKFLAIFFLAAVFWWFIFLSSFFTLDHIKVKGSDSIAPHQIRANFRQSLEPSPIFFDSKNLFYALLRKEKLKDHLKEKHPVFKRITITPSILTDEIEIRFEERESVAILEQAQGPNFYFDSQGVLFGEAPEYEGRLITLVESKQTSFKKGAQIAPKDLKESIIVLLKSTYLQKELNLSKISINAHKQELHAQVLDGVLLKFSISEAPLKPSDEIALLKKVMEKRVKSKRDQLKYIDLRVQNRAYVQYEKETE